MSFWYSDKEREVQMMRQRYLTNILQYNKHQIDEKQRRKQAQFKNFHEHSSKINQEAIQDLITQSNRNLRKREEQKMMLKDSYDRQIRQKSERAKEQKQKDLIYAYRQRERMDYEEDRRIFEISKMFNRVSYQGTPSIQHRRVRTEPNQPAYDINPERNIAPGTSSKNLDSIQIKLLPPHVPQLSSPQPPVAYYSNRNLGVQTEPADSLDKINYSFGPKQFPKKI